MRPLTDSERHVIVTLSAEFKSDAERKQLLADLENCSVEEILSDGSLLSFNIIGYDRPSGHSQGLYHAKDGFRAEGGVKDADGGEIDVLLFADQNNRVYEFELVKHQPVPIIKPDWSTFTVK
jgi:hypothetical protein